MTRIGNYKGRTKNSENLNKINNTCADCEHGKCNFDCNKCKYSCSKKQTVILKIKGIDTIYIKGKCVHSRCDKFKSCYE